MTIVYIPGLDDFKKHGRKDLKYFTTMVQLCSLVSLDGHYKVLGVSVHLSKNSNEHHLNAYGMPGSVLNAFT